MFVLREDSGAVSTLTLNRPDRRNALSSDMMRELMACFESLALDRSIRCVVLRGAGPAFCAGHDLDEMHGRTPDEYANIFGLCAHLMNTIQRAPQPVIAEVHAIATAAGCQLAATCDLVVASENARFAVPGVRIGLFCSTPMVALSRAIGRKRAMQMLLTGDAIDARTAAEWGLVNQVVREAELSTRTHELAQRVASFSGPVLAFGKRAFYDQIEADQQRAYELTSRVMCANAATHDAQEGINAFLEKRPPEWRHG